MGLRVFISLTSSDHALAEAVSDMLKSLFGDQVSVHFSTKTVSDRAKELIRSMQ